MKRMIIMAILPLLLSMASADEIASQREKLVKSEKDRNVASRIVVADYGALDSIDALGCSSHIVGMPKQLLPNYLHHFSDEQYVDVGGLKSLNIETIRGLSPDLIIISGRQEGSYQALNEIAPTMRYHFKPRHYLESLTQNVTDIASALGIKEQGKASLDELKKEIRTNRAVTKSSPLNAVIMLHNDEKLFASATNRFADFIHNVMGIKMADRALMEQSELVTTLYLNRINPDIIYLIDRSGIIGREPFDPLYFENEAIKEVSAIQNRRIIYLTSDLWFFGGDGLMSIPLQMQEVMAPFIEAEVEEIAEKSKSIDQ